MTFVFRLLSSIVALVCVIWATILASILAAICTLAVLAICLITLPLWMFVPKGPEEASEAVRVPFSFAGAVIWRMHQRLLVVFTGQEDGIQPTGHDRVHGTFGGTRWRYDHIDVVGTIVLAASGVLLAAAGFLTVLVLIEFS